MNDARRSTQRRPEGADIQDLPRRYDLARSAVAQRGFDADIQTKVSLFVGATTAVNATALAPAVLQGQVSVAYPFMHGQYFRELEFGSLLLRLTRWTMNPSIYAEGTALTAPLWAALWKLSIPTGPARGRAAFEALALGHALLGRVRVSPIIPEGISESNPYVVALQRIEQENGRMIQAQIRLLKDAKHQPLGSTEREQILEQRQAMVDALFMQFLGWIAGEGIAPAELPR